MMLQALLGLAIDVEAGTISTSPILPPDVKSVQLQGMNVMGAPLDVDIRAEGSEGDTHLAYTVTPAGGLVLAGRDPKAEE